MDTFGTHLVTKWHTSRYRRVLTGSNHHVNLHAGIDLLSGLDTHTELKVLRRKQDNHPFIIYKIGKSV